MQFKTKEHINKNVLIVVSLVVTFVLGFAASVGSVFSLPVAIAFCAMFMLATDNNKIVAVALSIVSIIPSAIFAYNGEINVIPILIAACGILSSVFYSKGISKTELVFYLTCLVLIALVLDLWTDIGATIGSYAVFDITEHLHLRFDEVALEMISILNESATGGESQMLAAEEIVMRSFDTLFNLMPAVIVIVAFFLTGVAMKVFSFALYKTAFEEEHVVFWRFVPTPIIAYFYCVLFVFATFLASANTTFAITVSNLFYVFLAIFAYVGFNFVLSIISHKRSPIFAWLVLAVTIFVLNIVAVELLSLVGVFFTHLSGRMKKT